MIAAAATPVMRTTAIALRAKRGRGDLAAAVADCANHVTLLEAGDLHGEVRIDATASRFDVDVRSRGRGEMDGDTAGARIDLETLDVRE